MDIKGLLSDQMGAFTTHDLWGAGFSVLMAALFALVVGLLGGGERGSARGLALLAFCAAAATVLVRGSAPLAIALVGLLLLIAPRQTAHAAWDRAQAARLLAVLVGLGCGAGGAVITALFVLPGALLLRWAFPAGR